MSRLDCVQESLRLALKELEPAVKPELRPLFWVGLWERYVESQVDYRASSETLTRKLIEAGTDAHQLLDGCRTRRSRPGGPKVSRRNCWLESSASSLRSLLARRNRCPGKRNGSQQESP